MSSVTKNVERDEIAKTRTHLKIDPVIAKPHLNVRKSDTSLDHDIESLRAAFGVWSDRKEVDVEEQQKSLRAANLKKLKQLMS